MFFADWIVKIDKMLWICVSTIIKPFYSFSMSHSMHLFFFCWNFNYACFSVFLCFTAPHKEHAFNQQWLNQAETYTRASVTRNAHKTLMKYKERQRWIGRRKKSKNNYFLIIWIAQNGVIVIWYSVWPDRMFIQV